MLGNRIRRHARNERWAHRSAVVVCLFAALSASCSAPSEGETALDSSLRPRSVQVFVVPTLHQALYHLGRQPNRYEREGERYPRHTVEVKTRHEAEGQRLDVHYGYNRVSDLHVSLLFDEDREHITASMRWIGDVGGRPPTVWTDVGGVVLVDRWPTDSLTPFRARFLLWGDLHGEVNCVSDAVSTEDAPTQKSPEPE